MRGVKSATITLFTLLAAISSFAGGNPEAKAVAAARQIFTPGAISTSGGYQDLYFAGEVPLGWGHAPSEKRIGKWSGLNYYSGVFRREHYRVYDGPTELGWTTDNAYVARNLSEGKHELAVRTYISYYSFFTLTGTLSNPRTYSVIIDLTPPTVPTHLVLDALQLYTRPGSGELFTRGEQAALDWAPSTDPPHPDASGVGGYRVYNHAGTLITTVPSPGASLTPQGKILPEGVNTYRVVTIDNVGNESARTPIVFGVDRSPPGRVAVGGDSYRFELLDEDLVAFISWDAVNDLPAQGSCGVKEYVVQRRIPGKSGWVGFRFPARDGVGSYTARFGGPGGLPAFAGETDYELRILAVDHLGNSTERQLDQGDVVRLFVPPTPIRFHSVGSEAALEMGTPTYRNRLILDTLPGGLSHPAVAGYRIERVPHDAGIPGATFSFTVGEITADIATLQQRWSVEPGSGRVAFTDTIPGAGRAHRLLKYRLVTEYRSGGAEAAALSQELRLANILPQFRVRLRNGAGQLLAEVDARGLDVATGNPAHVRVNGPVFLDLTLESGGSRDAEGDTLRYRLWTVNGSFLAESWAGAGSLKLSRSRSLTYPLYVSVEEFTDVLGSPPRYLADPALYGPAYQPQKTLHGQPPEGFFVSFDFGAPQGAFMVVSRGGGAQDELSVVKPTASRQVSLLVPAGSLTDAVPGGLDSGIDRLEIWNLDVEGLADVLRVVPEDIEARLGSNPHIEPIGVLSGPAPGTDRSIPWTLSPGEDGYRVVVMKVVDGAGNRHLYWRVVLVDTAAPAIPDTGTFRHIHQANGILLEWGRPPDDRNLRYRLSYPPSPGSPVVEVVTAKNSFLIPVGGYGPNRKITIGLRAVDLAGNESPPAAYSFYTLASLGTLSAPVQDYGVDGHSLSWALQGGVAAYQVLEALNTGQDGKPDGTVRKTLALANGKFRDTHLPPHGTLHYRLVAYNSFVPPGGGSGDRTVGKPFAVVLANHAPSVPAGLSPSGLARAGFTFRWAPCTDLDGDEIRYHLYCAPEATGTYRLLGTTSVEELAVSPLYFESGAAYRWYVEADDTPEGGDYPGRKSQSAAVTFTYDSAGPAIQLVDFPQSPFTNQESLTVRVSDDYAAAPSLVYWTSDGSVPKGHPQPVALREIEPLVFTGSIPLPETEAPYTVSFRARDAAGNLGELSSPVLRVDRTAPQLVDVELQLPVQIGSYLCGDGQVPAQMRVIDNYSGLHRYAYAFARNQGDPIATWQEILAELDVRPDGSFDEKAYRRVHLLEGDDGQSYYLALRLEDWAGNSSQTYYAPQSVFLDTSAPEAELEVEGLTASGGSYFTSDVDTLTVRFAYSDPHSAVTARYALSPANGGGQPDWRESWPAAAATGMVPGAQYRILAEAENRTGCRTRRASPPFTFDDTGPLVQAVRWSSQGPFVPGELLRLTVEALDPDSQIREYRVAAGTPPGGSELTSAVAGNRDGWLVKSNPTAAVDFSLLLPAVPDGAYRLTVAVENNAGIVSHYYPAQGIEIDSAQSKVVVWDNGPYSAEGLRASWRYTGPEEVAGFDYRVASQTDPEPAWIPAVEAQVSVAPEALVEGRLYWVEVRAALQDGATSPVGRSPGVVPDFTPPYFAESGALATPAACTSSAFVVSWNADDDGSGLQGVEVLLEGLDDQGQSVDLSSGWMPLSAAPTGAAVVLSADADGVPLAFYSGRRVYLTLRVTDGAGLSSEKASGLTIIDDTPPPAPVVVDQGEVINTAQSLEAQWRWTPPDPESGTLEYHWAAYKLGETLDSAVWTPAQKQTQAVASPGQHREIWFFAVKAVNAAGLESVGLSNGILCDDTAPFVSRVKVIGGGIENPAAADELNYVRSPEGLQLYIDTFDDESPVALYRAQSGTRNSLGDWAPAEGTAPLEGAESLLDLSAELFDPEAVTVFRGECINEAELLSEYGYSQGVWIDGGMPEIVNIHTSVSGEDIHFDWQVTGTSAPIEEYFAAFVPDGPPPELEQYLSVGTEPRYYLNTREAGIGEGRYRLYVGARNAAGVYTQNPGVSELVIIDFSPPLLSVFTTPEYASRFVPLYAAAFDEGSGISEYSYAVGSAVDPAAYSGGWLSRRSRASTLSILLDLDGLPAPVPHGETIFVRLRVRNGAGLQSGHRLSSPIVVDRTTASRPLVRCPKLTPYEHRIREVSIFSSDPESGITHYRLRVTADASLTNLEGAEPVQVASGPAELVELDLTGLSLEGLSLTENETYYLAVQVRNGAGDWSSVGYSNPFAVDATPPQLRFLSEATTIIVNDDPIEVPYTVSEDAEVTFTVIYPGGGSTSIGPVAAAEGLNSFRFAETAAGLYRLNAQAVDPAGNIGNTGPDASMQNIRVNAAPQITLLDVATTPGAPLTLSAAVYDPDGDAPFAYLWDFGDGSPPSEAQSPTHAYYHLQSTNPQTLYTVRLTVTDSAGKSGSAAATVTVGNSQRGRLYADEYWSGVHYLRGDLLVPAGIRLHTAPGTVVVVSGDPLGGYDHRLTVEGTLLAGAGSWFRLEEGATDTWNGLLVRGEVHLQYVTIEDAKRGVTVTASAQASLRDCALRDNQIGVHVLGNALLVERTLFSGNSIYGIKEDAGAQPTVRDCRFTGNLHDYYDEQLTVIDTERLNQMPGNSGNVRE